MAGHLGKYERAQHITSVCTSGCLVGFDEGAYFFAFGGEFEFVDGVEIADFVGFGAVAGGDLQAVEEESGALGVDLFAARARRTSVRTIWTALRSSSMGRVMVAD
jgi:hypothetical protein